MEGEVIDKHLKGGGKGWTLPLFSVVDHERQGPRAERYQKCRRRILVSGHRLGTRGHQVYRPFENPHDLMDLSIAMFCVLAAREHIQRRAVAGIVTEKNLFPCDELERTRSSMIRVEGVRGNANLGFEIFYGVGIHAKLSSPFQGGFKALNSFLYVPFRGSEVS